jgi:tubulin delta
MIFLEMFVLIFVGQCGNQIGLSFLSLYYAYLESLVYSETNHKKNTEYALEALELFFNETAGGPVARALCVDTEAKVIEKIHKHALKCKWKLDPKNVVFQKSGAGNNWAFGFYKLAPLMFDEQTEAKIKRLVASCKSFQGFVVFQSLAGGTGSGLGTYFTEKLRRLYPAALIFNQIVWPYCSGEVVVQNYNILLTITRLYKASNCILVHQNDFLHKICADRLGIGSVSFADLNIWVAHSLTQLFLPIQGDLNLIKALKSNPFQKYYKLMQILSVPQLSDSVRKFTNTTWESLIKFASQMLITNNCIDENINWNITTKKPFNPILNNFRRSAFVWASLRGVSQSDKENYNSILDDSALFIPLKKKSGECVVSKSSFGYPRSNDKALLLLR